MKTFKVFALDVWGHAPDECEALNAQGECECEGFQVNNIFMVGTLEIDETLNGAELLEALVANGYLDARVRRWYEIRATGPHGDYFNPETYPNDKYKSKGTATARIEVLKTYARFKACTFEVCYVETASL